MRCNKLNNNNLPELLSPAGNKESVCAAINNGCNAIYLGGKNFNARNSANNFSNDELEEMIDYAHLRNVKVYIAANTLYKDTELKELFEFLESAYISGADAFIVQDIGTALFIKKYFKDIKVHASTQMTIHSLEAVKYLGMLGFDRIILSRELSISEINEISKNTDIEIEVFVHGALCVSYSGQCTMSSIIGGRSGNRGKCAQTCRMKYDLILNGKKIVNGYLLSPKDMMTVEMLPELLNTNVASLKIEGRMKSPEYVSQVTKTYRDHLNKLDKEHLDENYLVDKDQIKELTQIFNRGGSFSTGYMDNHGSKEMMSIETPKSTGLYIGKVESYDQRTGICVFLAEEELTPGDGIEILTREVGTNINKPIKKGEKGHIEITGNIYKGDLVYRSYDKKLNDKLKKLYSKDTRKFIINGNIIAKIGYPLEVKLFHSNISVVAKGKDVEKPLNQPISSEKLIEQLSKTGSTPFTIQFSNNNIDENIYMGKSDINTVRREATELFENELKDSYKRTMVTYTIPKELKALETKKKITVLVKSKEIFDIVVEEEVGIIYLDVYCLKSTDIKYFIEKCQQSQTELFIALPTITRNEDFLELKKIISDLEKTHIDGYLVRNYGHLNILLDSSKKIATDYSFNVFNRLSLAVLNEKSNITCLSVELNLKELSNLANDHSEVLAYGKLPLMTLQQCPIGLYAGKKDKTKYCTKRNHKENYYLKDRKDIEFLVKTDCQQCIAQIFNNNPIFMINKMSDLRNLNVGFIRLEFNDENLEDIKEIVYAYNHLLENGDDSRTTIIREKLVKEGITYGHFYRGVE